MYELSVCDFVYMSFYYAIHNMYIFFSCEFSVNQCDGHSLLLACITFYVLNFVVTYSYILSSYFVSMFFQIFWASVVLWDLGRCGALPCFLGFH